MIGEDTDLLVLLIHHSPVDKSMFFKSEIKGRRLWDIKTLKHELGFLCRYMPFIHALLGCDTTSRVFGLGKNQAFQYIAEPNFQSSADVFLDPRSSRSAVKDAGENIMLHLYKTTAKTLGEARDRKFKQKAVAAKVYVQPQMLPPTSDAAEFHSRRVYHQVQTWMLNTATDPLQWGWVVMKGKLVPEMMSSDIAPAGLLKVIRCSCRTECRTRQCPCRNLKLECGEACHNCTDLDTCTNKKDIIHADDEVTETSDMVDTNEQTDSQ